MAVRGNEPGYEASGNLVLITLLPRISTSSSSKLSLGALRKESPDVSLSVEELTATCSILCTADYCLETTQQLEAKLKEKIDPPLAEKVNFTLEQDNFHSIISNCIQLLVQDMETACVSAFTSMVKIPWQNVESVGDQSPYVSTVAVHIRNIVPLLRENLSSARKYFINFCHKFANTFIPMFITYLYKCKPINTIAAEQVSWSLLFQYSLFSYN